MSLLSGQSGKSSYRKQAFRDGKDFSWGDMYRTEEISNKGNKTKTQRDRSSRYVRGTTSLMGKLFPFDPENHPWESSHFRAAILFFCYTFCFFLSKHQPGQMTVPDQSALLLHIGCPSHFCTADHEPSKTSPDLSLLATQTRAHFSLRTVSVYSDAHCSESVAHNTRVLYNMVFYSQLSKPDASSSPPTHHTLALCSTSAA